MPSAWRWTVTNPYGHSISCSEERWQHVVSRRPYMAGYEEIVKATVRFPDAIYLDPLRTADTYRADAWVTSYVAIDHLAVEYAGKLINVVIPLGTTPGFTTGGICHHRLSFATGVGAVRIAGGVSP